ncbi:ribosome small subunit-dependent GTPase A [Tenacibaculum sp. SDUM215027]|uniref:ribosome small subunit-dependent GTPase A n=1 Tax=Tenacibaculum sp. SDUM215027 TaxID=3422596 RepID=UPI003D3156B9
MKLEHFGYNDKIEKLKIEHNLEDFEIGRVISEHKERYTVKTEKGDFDAEITGNLRYTANTPEDFPAVGDWVALVLYDSYSSIIHKVLPRNSIISRKAVGQFGDLQIIATNINYAFIMQAVDRDFSINRIERYLTICNTSNIQPFIILTKIDLINEVLLSDLIDSLKKRINNVPIFAISNTSKQGFEKLKEIILKGKTYCLLGSSGVGKSTLVNTLANKHLMITKNVSDFSNRGLHSTTHRELIILDNGGILIDNPGMREVGMTDTSYGLEKTFEIIFEHSKHCKFKDCSHTIEIGCAVTKAVEIGEIDTSSYKNYLKMEKEKEHFEATVAEKRKKDKDFGKMVKHFKNLKKSSKY